MARRDRDLQLMLDKYSEASKLFGLTINLDKTEVFHQAAPSSKTLEPTIFADGTQLKNSRRMANLKYLGRIIFTDGSFDREITSRRGKTSQAVERLRTEVLSQQCRCSHIASL